MHVCTHAQAAGEEKEAQVDREESFFIKVSSLTLDAFVTHATWQSGRDATLVPISHALSPRPV